MILFSDGFEYFRPRDIRRKWGIISLPNGFDYWKIVQGQDNTVSPPQQYARRPDGRALYMGGNPNDGGASWRNLWLRAYIRKSRTVFMGFGFRQKTTDQPSIKVHFLTRNFPGLLGQIDTYEAGYSAGTDTSHLVASCLMVIRGTYMDIQWTFPSSGIPDVFGQVSANVSLRNGDWHYFQLGMTLHGNNPDGATAWVENRIGSNSAWKGDNVYTAFPGAMDGYYIDTVAIQALTIGMSFDDVYVTNDEGSINNNFLGPIYVRSIVPETQGAVNTGIGVNTSEPDRAKAVNAGMVGTFDTMPANPPAPEDDQHFVAWEDVREKYLQLPRINNEQTFHFSNPNFAGSEPKFFGAIAYCMCRPGYYDMGLTQIEPTMRVGLEQVPLSVALRRPLMFQYDNEWEIRRGVFENPDVNDATGFLSGIWNRTGVSNAEFGVKVIRAIDDPEAYLPEYLRVKYTFDDVLFENLLLVDSPNRFLEELIAGSITLESDASPDLTYALYDALGFADDEGSSGVKGVKIYVNSVIGMEDDVPWLIMSTSSVLAMEDAIQMTWLENVGETIEMDDDGYHWWVEEIPEMVSADDEAVFVFLMKALDNISMDDDVKTNHELIEDGFLINVTYIYSGHEIVMETLYPLAEASVGILAAADDGFDLAEEHYNGWYVAVINHQFSVVDEILTQHWRYEFLLGVCIRSWQVEPIEQQSTEGDRTGQLMTEFWDALEREFESNLF